MNTILTANIGETIEFLDWCEPVTETVLARRSGVTVTRGRDGRLSAWIAAGPAGSKYPQDTGWIFGTDTTPEAAIDRVLDADAGWAGLASGAAIADRWA